VELSFFLRGAVLGFSIAAPVGPIGVLCIRRTLAEGRLVGFVSGLGAASADLFFGCIAAFGIAFVSGFMVSQEMWLRLVGGGFLCYLGVHTFFARPATQPAQARSRGLAQAYASTLVLTLTNPMTIIAFAAVFAGLGIGSAGGDYAAAALLVLGVFCGSAGWWLILSGGVSLLRRRIDMPKMVLINRISGIIIGVFGVLAVASIAA
jgi:threonine/homoserine/homoserine lactone efflux protein